MAIADHEMPVAKLTELLSQLQPTDVLIPNHVANLSIIRDGKFIGWIDFLPCNHDVNWLGVDDDE